MTPYKKNGQSCISMGTPDRTAFRCGRGGCKRRCHRRRGPRYTSPLAVIEAAMELPELGEAGVRPFSMRRGSNCATCPGQHFDRRCAGDRRQAENSPACRLRGLLRDGVVRASDGSADGLRAVERESYDLPGSPHRLTVLHFGAAGTGRKALQAGLHADEFPGMLVLRILAGHLAEAEARGAVRGQSPLSPQANPDRPVADRDQLRLRSGGERHRGELQPELCRPVRPRRPVAGV